MKAGTDGQSEVFRGPLFEIDARPLEQHEISVRDGGLTGLDSKKFHAVTAEGVPIAASDSRTMLGEMAREMAGHSNYSIVPNPL